MKSFKYLIAITLFTASILLLTLYITSSTPQNDYNDGPYLFYKKNYIERIDIKSGNLQSKKYIEELPITRLFPPAPHDQYQNVEKIAAISDIHGQFSIFKKLLINNEIIDEELNWQYGNGHLIITGDIFDRGDEVTEALWLVFKLEQQAEKSGGKVHYLLGNHEFLVLKNNQRYLHEKYKHTISYFNNSLSELFSNDSVLGRWLRSKSTIIKVNSFLFLHAGIHQDLIDLNLQLEDINTEFRASIGKNKADLNSHKYWAILHGKTGPIWYRGYFRDKDLTQATINDVLNHFDAKKVIVGHTSMPHIETRFNNKVIAIDSSIKKGKSGELLLWDENNFYRATTSGNRTLLYKN